MDLDVLKAQLTGAVAAWTHLLEYGDGALVDLPLRYSDGDTVRLFVEPFARGVRVTDRATTATRLLVLGMNLATGRGRDLLREVRSSTGMTGWADQDADLSVTGPYEDAGEMLLRTAEASIQLDAGRWLAGRHHGPRFPGVVAATVESFAAGRGVLKGAPMPLKSGRTRKVTARVESDTQPLYIQAVALTDDEVPVEHCYFLFDNGAAPSEAKIAVLADTSEAWPKYIREELAQICTVAFHGDLASLSRALAA